MLLWGTVEDSRRTGRRRVAKTDKFHGFSEVLFESGPGEVPGPQAFLAHQDPNWVLGTHFHRTDQFQLVVRGVGTLGKHEIFPFTVHFSSKEAGYGPVVAGTEGLEYFTLRAVTDQGAYYLPEDRHNMRPGLQKRHFTAHFPQDEDYSTHSQGGSGTKAVIERQQGGLAVWTTRVAAGKTASAPTEMEGAGRFHVVIDGAFSMDDVRLPKLACVFTSPDEQPLSLTALDEDSEFVTLQFPVETER